MNPYLLAFVLGALGLLVMAVSGLGRHGGDAPAGHAAHAAPGSAPAAVHAALPGGGDGHVLGAARGPGGRGHAPGAARGARGARATGPAGTLRDALLALASPRVLFSLLLGFGATGLLFDRALGAPALLLAALAGGVLLERLAVAPVWRSVDRFASAPARTLETAIYDQARATSRFDANGEGLVALELDGQVVQLLGRLAPAERGLPVRAGDALRVEDVDPARNRCTVSLAGPGGRA